MLRAFDSIRKLLCSALHASLGTSLHKKYITLALNFHLEKQCLPILHQHLLLIEYLSRPWMRLTACGSECVPGLDLPECSDSCICYSWVSVSGQLLHQQHLAGFQQLGGHTSCCNGAAFFVSTFFESDVSLPRKLQGQRNLQWS